MKKVEKSGSFKKKKRKPIGREGNGGEREETGRNMQKAQYASRVRGYQRKGVGIVGKDRPYGKKAG